MASFGSESVGGQGLEVFITKVTKDGKFIKSKSIGSSGAEQPCGIGVDMDNNIYTYGMFSKLLRYDNQTLTCNDKECLFIVKQVNFQNFIWGSKAGDQDIKFDFDPTAKYVNFNAKLLTGKQILKPITEQEVSLLSGGNEVQTTKTDEYGDFSFKNVDANKSYSIEVSKNNTLGADEVVHIATQTGEVIKTLQKNKDNSYKYELIPNDIHKLSMMEVEDNISLLKSFVKDSKSELNLSENIYYAPGAITPISESMGNLAEVVKIMRTNVSLTLEINSFTDAVGDEKSNLALSQKRADNLVAFFTKKAITADRIKGVGFGEAKIINRCAEGISDCSEKELQANRRTEFKFVKAGK